MSSSRQQSPVLVVFKATEQEDILAAVEESGIEVLGQSNAETSNIVEVIEMLQREQSGEEGACQDSDATINLEYFETDESMYQGKPGSNKMHANLPTGGTQRSDVFECL